ncbi:MAG: bifunctional riboflavin kinase/FAD synthetase [Chloroflexota bacterium]|nr:bifunctional riboflavin kinase/FAD synthetase [Chloroflexota bacterium]MDQ5865401.1 bifunctional riboflavin kinase/FAD synthetase [Chloroflexota bacterium]
MQTITDLTQRQPTPAVLTIGSFDGVHLGHQALIAGVVESARARNVAAVALTFEPSPREVLRPELSLAYLTRLPQKLELLGSLGLDETIVVPFTQELSRVQAPDFIAMLRQYLPFVEMWEGEGFALGHGRTGNTDVLARLGEELGYTLRIAPLVQVEGEPVSSTRVRQAVAEGDVEAAARLLGRPYGVPGVVVHGSKRGRELGYPTANLDTPPNQAIPADGVYATWCVRPATGETLPSLTSIGVRPMFENDVRLVEVYILDYDADLYDETLTAQFVHYLRPQQRFDGLEAFIAQMRQDEANARKLLGVR